MELPVGRGIFREDGAHRDLARTPGSLPHGSGKMSRSSDLLLLGISLPLRRARKSALDPIQAKRGGVRSHSGNREEIFHIELASDQGSSAIGDGIGPMGILPLKIWHFIDSRDDPIGGSPFLALDSSGRFQNKPASGSRLISKKSGWTSSSPTACGGRPMRLCQ